VKFKIPQDRDTPRQRYPWTEITRTKIPLDRDTLETKNELQITFFYGPDGSGWVHMKGNGPLSVSEVQERPDMVKYAHSSVSEKPTLKGG